MGYHTSNLFFAKRMQKTFKGYLQKKKNFKNIFLFQKKSFIKKRKFQEV